MQTYGTDWHLKHPFILSLFVAITCDPPVDPRHGIVLPVRESFIFGSFATIRCDSGFVLRGKQKLKCIKDIENIGTGGKWDAETPTCEGEYSSG